MKSIQIAGTEKKLISHSQQRPLMWSMPNALPQPKKVRRTSVVLQGLCSRRGLPDFENPEKGRGGDDERRDCARWILYIRGQLNDNSHSSLPCRFTHMHRENELDP